MDESFSPLAVIELPGGPVGADAGQRGDVEHPPKSAIVAFWPVQVPADAARIPWHRHQSGIVGQAAGVGEGCQVPAGSHQGFRAEVGSETGQRLDDPRVGVIPKTLGDGLVDVFDLAVRVQSSEAFARIRSVSSRAISFSFSCLRTSRADLLWANASLPQLWVSRNTAWIPPVPSHRRNYWRGPAMPDSRTDVSAETLR
jgi:hypothetical protein